MYMGSTGPGSELEGLMLSPSFAEDWQNLGRHIPTCQN